MSPASRRAFSWGGLQAGSGAWWRPVRAGLAAATVLATAACLDLGIAIDTVFPATIPGLRSGQPWVALPIGSWVVEGGITAEAIVACFDPACTPSAAIGLFRASGPDALRLGRLLDEPAALRQSLVRRIAEAPRVGGRRVATPGPTRVEVTARREGPLAGFALRLTRPDGSREAAGLVLARRTPDEIRMILIIAPTQDAADSIAHDVAPHLG